MLNDIECPAVPELANDCRQLLRDFYGRTIGLDFDVALCHVVAKHKGCIQDFHWRADPTPPEEYTRYVSLIPKDKAIFRDQNPTFFIRGKVAIFLDARDMIRALNTRNMEQLLAWQKLSGIIPEARDSVDKILNTFSGRMGK